MYELLNFIVAVPARLICGSVKNINKKIEIIKENTKERRENESAILDLVS